MSDEIGMLLDFYYLIEKTLACERDIPKDEVMDVLKESVTTSLRRGEHLRSWNPDMRDTTFMLFALWATIETTIRNKSSWSKPEALEVIKTGLLQTVANEVTANQKGE